MLPNYSKNSWDSKLNSFYNYDLEINKDNDLDESIFYTSKILTKGLIAQFDTNNINSWNGLKFKSLKTWSGATLSSFTLSNIGLTGVDTNIVQNFSGITLNIASGGTLSLVPIRTHPYYQNIQNSGILTTSYDFSGLYLNFNNKILQGNFKLDGYPHQTLPKRTERGITFDFWINFKNQNVNLNTGQTLNSLYPENTGIFFYMGVKAANKFSNKLNSESGLTTTTGVELYKNDESTGNTYSGLALFYKNNKIGCKTLIPYLNSNNETYHKIVVQETSSEIFTGNTESNWINLTVKFERYVSVEIDDCSLPILFDSCIPNDRKGILTFYINGRPVHKINDWVEPIFDRLNCDKTKQEMVPYTISLGGGTQGLEYNLTLNDDKNLIKDINDDKIIEEAFGGTFSGGLSQFNIYDRPLSVHEIIHNFKVNQKRYRRKQTFGGNKIIIDKPFI